MPDSPAREARRSAPGGWLAATAAVVVAIAASCRAQSGPLADPNTALTPETHTFFPIATGAHAGVDCNVCHGAFDSFKEFDCLTCHTQPLLEVTHSGMPGYAWENPRCRACHPDGTSNFDHTLLFPIGAGRSHNGIACATCHTDPANRRVFDCAGCHTQAATDPWHTGVAGYAWSSPQCYACHPSSNIPDFPHPAFPVGPTAVHKDISCKRCHADQVNLRAIDCLACHPATTNSTAHAAVGGFTSTTAACLRCHGDSQVDRVVAHLPFLIAPAYRHYRESCVRCHPAYRTDKPFAADFGVFDCLTCHASVHDRQYTSNLTCVRSGCHPNGRKP